MRILIIEDNPKLAAAIAGAVQEIGYASMICATGFEGEDVGASEDFDAIVLDLMLPDREGIDVCRNLRKREVATPILVLSALSTTEQKVACLDAGADDYLTKPFEYDELLARLRALLRRATASESTKLEYGDLTLDLHQRHAVRQEQSIKLSTREFSLLEYLMRNPDRVLPRSVILEKVWDMMYEPTSNVVDVYISGLRKKIDKDFEPRLIHTVVGAGYRFGQPGI